MEDGPKQVSHASPRNKLESIVQEVEQQQKTHNHEVLIVAHMLIV